MKPKFFVGLDISKDTIDAALVGVGDTVHRYKVKNNATAITGLLKTIRLEHGCSRGNTLLCAEDMGIFTKPLVSAATKKGMQVCLENPYRINRSQGIVRGKDDSKDAERIALYLQKNHASLRYYRQPRPCMVKLRELNTIRQRLVRVRKTLTTGDKLDSHFLTPKERKLKMSYWESTLESLNQDLENIHMLMRGVIENDERLSELNRIMVSIPRVGEVLSRNMLIYTNEFLNFPTAKHFASYCGVAPFAWLSGSSIIGKPRISPIANREMKSLLHLSAIGYTRMPDTALGKFYLRKVQEGKNKMSILNAIRNKIIQRIFACVLTGQLYSEDDFGNSKGRHNFIESRVEYSD